MSILGGRCGYSVCPFRAPVAMLYASRCKSPLSSSSPRNVYIDVGVNWGNTARLFEEIHYDNAELSKPIPGIGYHVFGFEASPLIQPFAERYFQWLNGFGDEPVSCLPRSGSTAHLRKYAPFYGCNVRDDEEMRKCMWTALDRNLGALSPDSRLNSSALISTRLDEACPASAASAPANANRFTFIPAAAGSGSDEYMEFFGPPQQTIRGGSLPKSFSRREKNVYDHRVRVVNICKWLNDSFTIRDHLVLKMDVEGAEHGIVSELARTGVAKLLDVFSVECHPVRHGSCQQMLSLFVNANPSARILREGKNHAGYDRYARRELNDEKEQLAVTKACSSVDPTRFLISKKRPVA